MLILLIDRQTRPRLLFVIEKQRERDKMTTTVTAFFILAIK